MVMRVATLLRGRGLYQECALPQLLTGAGWTAEMRIPLIGRSGRTSDRLPNLVRKHPAPAQRGGYGIKTARTTPAPLDDPARGDRPHIWARAARPDRQWTGSRCRPAPRNTDRSSTASV